MLVWHPATPGLLAAAAVISRASQADTVSPSSPTDWLSTLGPFGAAIALSYYLLRRSDTRESEATQAYRVTETRLLDDLAEARRQNTELRERLRAAENDD